MNRDFRKKAFGTHEIARICHVTPPTAIRWINEGKIPSFTTGGGHRRVWGEDLAAFMREHNMPLPEEFKNADGGVGVLIVEDDEEARELIRRIINAKYPGLAVETAADGLEAGYKLHTAVPSVVVLDLQLPRVNGFMVCGMIRADERLRGVKILAITAHNTPETKEQVLRAGADDFLAKPFEMDELTGKLNGLLNGERRGEL